MEYSDHLMQEAFEEAKVALKEGEVPVGAIFYCQKSGQIIARGHNSVNLTKNATRHAELNCIEACQSDTDLNHVVVYVNVEPCIMCAGALLEYKVAAVYFGCRNDRFGGCGSVLNVQELVVDSPSTIFKGGFREQEAIDLLKNFYKGENPNAPVEKRKPARD